MYFRCKLCEFIFTYIIYIYVFFTATNCYQWHFAFNFFFSTLVVVLLNMHGYANTQMVGSIYPASQLQHVYALSGHSGDKTFHLASTGLYGKKKLSAEFVLLFAVFTYGGFLKIWYSSKNLKQTSIICYCLDTGRKYCVCDLHR